MSYELKPGSDEAVKAGCQCPVIDNSRGKGYLGVDGIYVTSSACPLHGVEAKAIDEKLNELKAAMGKQD